MPSVVSVRRPRGAGFGTALSRLLSKTATKQLAKRTGKEFLKKASKPTSKNLAIMGPQSLAIKGAVKGTVKPGIGSRLKKTLGNTKLGQNIKKTYKEKGTMGLVKKYGTKALTTGAVAALPSAISLGMEKAVKGAGGSDKVAQEAKNVSEMAAGVGMNMALNKMSGKPADLKGELKKGLETMKEKKKEQKKKKKGTTKKKKKGRKKKKKGSTFIIRQKRAMMGKDGKGFGDIFDGF